MLDGIEHRMAAELSIKILTAAADYFNNKATSNAFDMAIAAIRKHDIKEERIVLRFDDAVRVGAAVIKAGAKVYKCPKCGTFVLASHKYCH